MRKEKAKEITREELERKLVLRTQEEMDINGLLYRIKEAKKLGYLSVVVYLREELAKIYPDAAEDAHNTLQQIMTPWYEKQGRKLRYLILDEVYKSYPALPKKSELSSNTEKPKNLEAHWAQIKFAASSYIERHRREISHNKSSLEKLTEEELTQMWDGRTKSENY